MTWLEGTRARLRLLFARRAAEQRMEAEFRFHLEMEAERIMREAGLDRREAWRRARVAFGGQERYREEMREGRGLAWLMGLRLNLRHGIRALRAAPVGVAGDTRFQRLREPALTVYLPWRQFQVLPMVWTL